MTLWVDGKQTCQGFLRQGKMVRKGSRFLLGQTVTKWVPLQFSTTHEYNGDMAYFNVFEDIVSNVSDYRKILRKSFLGEDAAVPWSTFFLHAHGKVKMVAEEKLYIKAFTSLRCLKSSMILAIYRAAFKGLNSMETVLSDNVCKVRHVNETHMVFKANHTGCRTALHINNNTATYSNVVKTREPLTGRFSRDGASKIKISREPGDMPRQGISFKCTFPTDIPTYTPLYTPYVNDTDISEYGKDKFKYHVHLYTDTTYTTPYTRYPISVAINHRIAVEVKMNGHDDNPRYIT